MRIVSLILCLLLYMTSTPTNLAKEDVSFLSEYHYELGHGLIYGEDYLEMDEKALVKLQKVFFANYSNDPDDAVGVVCAFDISESGRLAIATRSQTILVFSESGDFQYSLALSARSGEYGVIWAGENIALMNIRSNSAYVLSEQGDIITAYRINIDKKPSYWDDIVCVKKRFFHGKEYYLDTEKPNLGTLGEFMLGYKYLIVRSPSGQEAILYESSEAPLDFKRLVLRKHFTIIETIVFCLGIIWVIVFWVIRAKNKKNNVSLP